MSQTRKIRWLIAHEPINLFLRTAEAFKEKIAELTNNEFEVIIYTPSEYIKSHGKVPNEYHQVDPMVSMDAGDLEMSQLHISELARFHSADFFALELPFIFRDHEHAARVLEGQIGKNLLDGLVHNSPAKGLAFTYSGGFRCVVSKEKFSTIDDLKGVSWAVAANPVTIDSVATIGAIPKEFHIRDFAQKVGYDIEGYESDVLETTIPRYLAQFQGTDKKYLLNTKHSLFLTSIVIQNEFWNSLDADTQAKFQEACTYASRLERKWSVEDAEAFAAKENHSEIGVEYSELNAEETEKFKKCVQPVVDKYKDFFTAGLVDGIIRS